MSMDWILDGIQKLLLVFFSVIIKETDNVKGKKPSFQLGNIYGWKDNLIYINPEKKIKREEKWKIEKRLKQDNGNMGFIALISIFVFPKSHNKQPFLCRQFQRSMQTHTTSRESF